MTKEYKVITGGMYSGFVEYDINEVPKKKDMTERPIFKCEMCPDRFCRRTNDGGRIENWNNGLRRYKADSIEECGIRDDLLNNDEVEDFWDRNNIGS